MGPQSQRTKEGLLRGQLVLCWAAWHPSPPGGGEQLPEALAPAAKSPPPSRMQKGELSLGPLRETLGKQLHLLEVSTPVLSGGGGELDEAGPLTSLLPLLSPAKVIGSLWHCDTTAQ